ncbi:MAG: hypothetical protein HYZ26_03280 [Chloroflexi bacterium]|nr:hypothetical protein [Chloroflexota bacterium]
MFNRSSALLAVALLTGFILPAVPSAQSASVHAKQASEDGPPPGFELRLLPEGGLAAGDRVSFILLPPVELDMEGREFRITPPGAEAVPLGPAGFGAFGIGGETRAILQWAWDTATLPPGKYRLSFSIQPGDLAWRQWLTLRPAETLPAAVRASAWQSIQTECCLVFFASGTASQRDLEDLLEVAQDQSANVVGLMQAEFVEPVRLVLLPRVLGHGGFATDEIYISYLDRNYAGNDLGQVLHHELVHILDARLGGGLRPTMLVEGLAVYLSGGHFKPEPLLPRAAALLSLGWYIPLDQLAERFYFHQHEVGYLEAAALVEYMIARWGYAEFDSFYRGIQPVSNRSHAEAIDAALQAHYSLTLDDLEREFYAYLGSIELDPADRDDVRLTVAFFDSVRRYQQALDPNAYFLTAWLLDIDDMQLEGITADYVRHPAGAANLALEVLLIEAEEAIREGDYAEAERAIQAVNAVLDADALGAADPFAAHPLAADALAIVRALLARGYVVERIDFGEGQAVALVSRPEAALLALTQVSLVQDGATWRIQSSTE